VSVCAGYVVVNDQRESQHDALQHDAGLVDHQVAANADAAHLAIPAAHEANVANDRQQHANIPAHHDDHADINAAGDGPVQQHLPADIGKLDRQADEHPQQVLDRPHGAAML